MKICMICNTDGALYVFRKPIIEAAVAQGHVVHAISDESTYFTRLKALGVHPHAMRFARHSVGMADNLSLLFGLLRAIRSQAPDIVHGFTHKPAIYGTLAARLAGVRTIVVTITGLGTLFIRNDWRSRLLRQLLLAQYRLALCFVRCVFFQNPDDLEYFVSRGIVNREKAVLTAGSGLDLVAHPLPDASHAVQARASVAAELGTGLDGKRVVLFPARGVREKGFHEFYLAAKAVHERAPGLFVFIHLGLVDAASSGVISKQGIEQYASNCGVHYLGFKDDIARYMTACDVVALPSYREGTPRSLIESLALGKCIVTTDTPGCRETVVEGWNGYLCKVADVDSLVQALLKTDEDFVIQARLRSRQLCEDKYDSTHLVKLTLQKYFAQSFR